MAAGTLLAVLNALSYDLVMEFGIREQASDVLDKKYVADGGPASSAAMNLVAGDSTGCEQVKRAARDFLCYRRRSVDCEEGMV